LRRVRRHAAARVPPPQLHRGVRPVRAGPRRGHAPAQRRAQRGPAAPGPLRGPPAAAARRRRAHPVALGGAGRRGRRRRRGRRAPRLPHGRGPGAPAGQRPDLGPRGADRPAHRVHLRRHRPALVAGPRRAGRRGPPPPPRGGRGVTARRVAVVVAGGGPPAVTREQLGDLGDRPVVVAADEGLQHAEALGLRVDLVVGDMDSVDPGALAAADAAGVPLQRHPAAKDATDLELALDAALAAEVDRVVVVTGTGDRLDHTMAVALTVSAPDRVAAAAVAAWVGRAHVWVVAGEASLAGRPGELLSLLPAHGPAVGVTTSGLLYPLADEDLPAGIGRGVSNEWVAEVATVRVRPGILLAVAPGAAAGARAPRSAPAGAAPGEVPRSPRGRDGRPRGSLHPRRAVQVGRRPGPLPAVAGDRPAGAPGRPPPRRPRAGVVGRPPGPAGPLRPVQAAAHGADRPRAGAGPLRAGRARRPPPRPLG